MSRYTREDVRLRFPSGAVHTRPWLDSHPRAREELYRESAERRVVCECHPAGVEMTVRRVGVQHHLANLPGRAHHHAPSCPSFVPDPSIDARQDYSRAALMEVGGGVLHATVRDAAPEPAPYEHMTPRAALELLWSAAELTHWAPKMTTRRTVLSVRATLKTAAARLVINDEPLADSLYLAEPERPRGTRQPLYVLGELHRVVRGAHSLGLALRYDTTGPYWVARSAWSPPLSALLGSYDQPRGDLPSVWVLARTWYTAHHAHCRWVGALHVTASSLPIEHPAEEPLLDQLVRDGRRFVRVPGLDSSGDPRYPILTLIDTATPVNVHSPMATRLPAPFAPPSAATAAG
jgi:hypothetical protein